jgi:DNA polymerase/3'-5' exonuclease PolX
MSDAPKRPLSLVAPIAQELVLLLAPACQRIEVAGSIRRIRPEVSDIEIVAIPRLETVETGRQEQLFGDAVVQKEERNVLWAELDRWVPEYRKKGDVYRQFFWPLRQGGESTEHISVDLFTATKDNWGLIFLIRTGSGNFSQHVVSRLAQWRRPSFQGYVRDATGIPPSEMRGLLPGWSDKVKTAMPVIPTPEEGDVFRLAAMGVVQPSERSW